MQLSEQTLIESQIGFVAGILVGALGSWVYLIFFTNIDWWVKVLACIGEIGIAGSLLLSLRQGILARRNYLEMKKMMETAQPNTAVVWDEGKEALDIQNSERRL